MNLMAIAVFLRFEESTDQNGRYLGNIPLDCSFHSLPAMVSIPRSLDLRELLGSDTIRGSLRLRPRLRREAPTAWAATQQPHSLGQASRLRRMSERTASPYSSRLISTASASLIAPS